MSLPCKEVCMSRVLAFVSSLLLLPLLTPFAGQAQDPERAREAWRERLGALAPGVWVASNATWQEEDGGVERFGLDWVLLPGGLAARGCLWGERGESRMVFWEFSQYWDPIAEEGVLVQTGPGGALALGRVDPLVPEREIVVQTMVPPRGPRFEIGHTTETEGADVRIDHSFRRNPGATEWTPGRTYRWERHPEAGAPCWG